MIIAIVLIACGAACLAVAVFEHFTRDPRNPDE